MHWAFEQLGLPADADARTVKRAYAQRLKRTRPDEDPQGFQQLREAYEAALELSTSRPPVPQDAGGVAADVERVPVPDWTQAGMHPVAADGGHVEATQHPGSPYPTLRMHIAQGGSDAWRGPALPLLVAPDARIVAPAPLTAFRLAGDLMEQAETATPAAFAAWLAGHDALFDLGTKSALAEPLMHELDGRRAAGHGVLGPRHLDALLRFFWLDQVSETRQRLAPVLERLMQAAQRREDDWDRIMSTRGAENRSRPARAPPFWAGLSPTWIIILFLLLVHSVRACRSAV